MDVERRVAGFLLVHLGDDFCDRCLAEEAGVPVEQSSAAVLALRLRAAFLRDRWRCSRCGRSGLVTRALPNRTVALKRGTRRVPPVVEGVRRRSPVQRLQDGPRDRRAKAVGPSAKRTDGRANSRRRGPP